MKFCLYLCWAVLRKNDFQYLTCNEVCIFAAQLVFLLEIDLAEGNEGENGNVVANADEADEPE